MNERIAIVNGFRTAFTKAGTLLKHLDADQLGVFPLKESILRSGVKPDEIDEAVVGCCGQPVHAANVVRVISLRAGLPKSVPAVTVHRNCASGMRLFLPVLSVFYWVRLILWLQLVLSRCLIIR